MQVNQELIDKSSPIPAYHQIVNDIMDRITALEWEMHSKLPSESMLASEYGVSRVTVRQAMAELEKLRIIARQQGKGAFLIGQPQPFVENLNLPSVGEVSSPVSRNTSKVIDLRLDSNPPRYARTVFADKAISGPLVYLCRIFSKEGRPIGLNYAWFPSNLVPRLVEQGLINSSVTATLKGRYSYDISQVDNIIEATKANAVEASLLEVSYNSSLLRIQSVHYANEGLFVQFSNTLWVGDLTRFRFTAK